MLHRRIGMIWTRSGCAVCTRPRTNSRAERSLRLAVIANDIVECGLRIADSIRDPQSPVRNRLYHYAFDAMGRRRLTRSPMRSEPLKIEPTGMNPKR